MAMNRQNCSVAPGDLSEIGNQGAGRILFLGGTANEWQGVASHLKGAIAGVELHCLEEWALPELKRFQDCLAVVIDYERWTNRTRRVLTDFKEHHGASPVLLCVKFDGLESALNELGDCIDDYVIKAEGYEPLLGRRIQWLRGRLARLERESTDVSRLYQQAQKLEALGVLAGGFAHKFNNILTAVLGHTQMAIAALPEGSSSDNLSQVMEAGIKARDLVRQLASMSHLREGAPRKVVVGTIVKETLKFFRTSLPSTIQIQEDLKTAPSGWDTVLCDPVHCYQIFSTLCTKALSGLSASNYGTLQVKLFPYHVQEEDVTAFSHLKNGRYVALQVCALHEGIGTDPARHHFDPYPAGERSHLGMALATVKKLANEYGGGVDIDCSLDERTTITVLLPAVEVLKARGGTDTGAPLPMGSERILLVDDEETVVHVGSGMLERLGYKVTAFVDSRQALDYFRDNPSGVDLLLTDLTMPDMNGLDLAAGVFAIQPDMPVIMCTGYTDELTADKMKQMGLDVLIRKPFIMKLLATTVRDTLDRRRGRRQE